MIGKKLLHLAKTWGTGLIVPLLVGVLIGKGDVTKVPFATVFPEHDSIGGVTFPLSRVPAATHQPSWIEVVLVRQTMKPTMRIEFLRTSSIPLPDVFAGMTSEHTGSAMPLTGGVNGTRFLELEIPEKTLGGTSLLLTAASSQKARYVVTVGDVTKDLSDPDDLVVYTKNEARRITLVHLLIGTSVAIALFYVARTAPLRHPTREELEDQQWV